MSIFFTNLQMYYVSHEFFYTNISVGILQARRFVLVGHIVSTFVKFNPKLLSFCHLETGLSINQLSAKVTEVKEIGYFLSDDGVGRVRTRREYRADKGIVTEVTKELARRTTSDDDEADSESDGGSDEDGTKVGAGMKKRRKITKADERRSRELPSVPVGKVKKVVGRPTGKTEFCFLVCTVFNIVFFNYFFNTLKHKLLKFNFVDYGRVVDNLKTALY